MSEQFPQSEQQKGAETRINDIEMAHLGGLTVQAGFREDLGAVSDQHVVSTGVENPNSIGSGFFVAGGEISMSDESVYRQVGMDAVEDLAMSGIVRNRHTAQGEQSHRWGDKVFWHAGDSDKMMHTGGRAVIEADKAAAEAGWITADKVTGIYVKDSDGVIKNILPSS